MKRVLVLSVILLMCIAFVGCSDLTAESDTSGGPVAPTASTATTTATAATLDVGRAGVTLANFDEIQVGMTYQEVVNIIGEEGTLVSTTAAVPMVYQWSGNGGKITVFFVDDRVANAAPTGLK